VYICTHYWYNCSMLLTHGALMVRSQSGYVFHACIFMLCVLHVPYLDHDSYVVSPARTMCMYCVLTVIAAWSLLFMYHVHVLCLDRDSYVVSPVHVPCACTVP
jgi:hypothetical protein